MQRKPDSETLSDRELDAMSERAQEYVPDSRETDPYAYARDCSLPVLKTVRRIAIGGGGRGAQLQLAASRMLLEVAQLIGSKAEAPKPLSAVKEAAKVIYLVDADKAQELLSQRRAEEQRK